MIFNVAAKYDVVILGSGISGLICALELAKENKSVCIITKEAITESSSQYAQGGIAVPLSNLDSFEKHLQDTLKAGAGLCSLEVAKQFINCSVNAFEKLVSYGVKFDISGDNSIHQTREAAHTISRVCHIGGDATGRQITKILIDRVCRESNISISQGTMALNFVKEQNTGFFAILVEEVTKDKYVLLAKNLIVATGGLGQIFQNTTNPEVSSGDGIIMSYNAGALLQDIELIQFHPTVLFEDGDPVLVTEAIRGEGATLKNKEGECFASKYHEMADLAPRDILSRAIYNEIRKTNSKYIFLDVSNFNKDYFKTRFPNVYQNCLNRNINLFETGIPVAPAAHYLIGGVKCDVSGKTNIPGLWVVGEASGNGFHGANRLASNSLLECIAAPHFLVKALLSLNENIASPGYKEFEIKIDENIYDENEVKKNLLDLKLRNEQNLGLIRNGNNLSKHFDWLTQLSDKFNCSLPIINFQSQELKNMIMLSQLICLAALERKYSIGVHFREDYKSTSKELKHSIFYPNLKLSWEIELSEKQLIPFLT